MKNRKPRKIKKKLKLKEFRESLRQFMFKSIKEEIIRLNKDLFIKTKI